MGNTKDTTCGLVDTSNNNESYYVNISECMLHQCPNDSIIYTFGNHKQNDEVQKGCVLTMHVLYPHITFWIGHKVYCVMTIPERQNNPQFAVLVRLIIFTEGMQQVQTPMDLEMPPTYEGSALLYQQLQQTDNGTMSKKQLRRFAQELCNVNSKQQAMGLQRRDQQIQRPLPNKTFDTRVIRQSSRWCWWRCSTRVQQRAVGGAGVKKSLVCCVR